MRFIKSQPGVRFVTATELLTIYADGAASHGFAPPELIRVGSAYSANCRVPVARFSVERDAGTLRHFESSPGAKRAFCGTCGSPVYARVESDPEHIRIRLGTLDREAAAMMGMVGDTMTIAARHRAISANRLTGL